MRFKIEENYYFDLTTRTFHKISITTDMKDEDLNLIFFEYDLKLYYNLLIKKKSEFERIDNVLRSHLFKDYSFSEKNFFFFELISWFEDFDKIIVLFNKTYLFDRKARFEFRYLVYLIFKGLDIKIPNKNFCEVVVLERPYVLLTDYVFWSDLFWEGSGFEFLEFLKEWCFSSYLPPKEASKGAVLEQGARPHANTHLHPVQLRRDARLFQLLGHGRAVCADERGPFVADRAWRDQGQ